MQEIRNMFESPQFRQLLDNVDSRLTEALDYVIVSCKKYIDIVSSYDIVYQTQLDVERRKLCLREMVRNMQ